jgi:acetoin utilization deacetylase AcuC-like enzyme
MKQFFEKAEQFKPDLIFVACGADAHLKDPLTSLEYSIEGYVEAAKALREKFPSTPILMGGAGDISRTPSLLKFGPNLQTL